MEITVRHMHSTEIGVVSMTLPNLWLVICAAYAVGASGMMMKMMVKTMERMKAKTTKKMVKVKATARMKARSTRMKAKTTRKMVKVKAMVVIKVGMNLSPVTAYVMQMTSLAGLDAMSASTVSSEMVNVKIRSHLSQLALSAQMSVMNVHLRTWTVGENVTLASTHTSMMKSEQ